ncbi:hypothetical protein C8N46_10986 [Kordia periserrulae]|uniref:Uncharacterized protein n=1 Tax=Kordia periserrulae TaxID=701523 RepID=A0A2T6BU50_9FLAO|nr:hypothetical protein [Kordia periserrulae]PTX59497.1 hypothetical protein C8N46_10986 [Kordia periserrulae]
MKKKQVNLRQLALKKSSVASLESKGLTGGTYGTGGYQSWTGTAEPCFSDFDCGTVGCGTGDCPQETDGCPVYTDGCPPPTNNCGTIYGCGQTALYSACNGLQCY